MTSAKNIYDSFRAAERRSKLAILVALAAALSLVLVVLPAIAGSGLPSAPGGVVPTEINWGGGPGACDFIESEYEELHINNPRTDRFNSPSGVQVDLVVEPGDKYFSYTFVDPSDAAYEVVVNGGQKSTLFNNIAHGPPLTSDGQIAGLHPPTKGNSETNLYKLSHVTFCFGTNPFADLSITKSPLDENGQPVDPDADFFANVGDLVTFHIVVSNSESSTVPATDVVVTDTLPAGMILHSSTPEVHDLTSGINSDGLETVTWTIEEIDPGTSVTLELVVEITPDAAGQDVVNQVSAVGSELDPNSGEDNENVADSEPSVLVTADVSGLKYHDRDTDGSEDPTEEEGLDGWLITAFDENGAIAGSATTGLDDPETEVNESTYTIANLPPGLYTVCEKTPDQAELPVDSASQLPSPGFGFTWSWTQSDPANALCAAFVAQGYEAAGYSVNVNDDIPGKDFGNHLQVGIDCSLGDVIVELGGTGLDDDPHSTVTIPGGTKSCTEGIWKTTYDVGRSEFQDEAGEAWTQFVIFGGFPLTDDAEEFTQVIVWDAEEGMYVDADLLECVAGTVGCSLLVPTTQVNLFPGDPLVPVEFCGSNDPTPADPQCLESRTIAEGAPLEEGYIQLTEHYRFLGDPGRFR